MKLGLQVFLTKYVKTFLVLTLICPPMSYLLNFMVSWALPYVQPGTPLSGTMAALQSITTAWVLFELALVLSLFASILYPIIRATRYRNNDSREWGP